MIKHVLLAAAASLAAPLCAQEAPEGPPSPNAIVAQANAEERVQIAPNDLLVMTLAPDAEGNAREVVIQLMPAPCSQGWVENIRLLARSGWYDDISVNRVQDNYVVQWGDPNYDNPEATGEAKPLPEGLRVMEEANYASSFDPQVVDVISAGRGFDSPQNLNAPRISAQNAPSPPWFYDPYPGNVGFAKGYPIAASFAPSGPGQPLSGEMYPVHCYGMVGVGRGYSPDTGSGAELYTVIGHAPRHLDRNIALVGRVIEGIEHLSSLPRGKGALGFYEDPEKRVPILSIRVASDLPENEQPSFEYLTTEGETFARYAEARANRRDPFFIVPAGGADICNIPVPIRRTAASE